MTPHQTIQQFLDAIKEHDEKMTKRPWLVRTLKDDCFIQGTEVVGQTFAGKYRQEILSDEEYPKKKADADGVSFSRTAMPQAGEIIMFLLDCVDKTGCVECGGSGRDPGIEQEIARILSGDEKEVGK